MGCAASKDISVAAAKAPSSRNKKLTGSVQGALKRVFYPFADEILLKDLQKKQVTSGDRKVLQVDGVDSDEENVKRLGEILRSSETLTDYQLEVINVWELMEGLEDDDDEEILLWAETSESRIVAAAADVSDADQTDIDQDHQEFDSSSSPDSTIRLNANFQGSPTSPLCFDSPQKRSGRRSYGGRDIVLNRNFSFNLRSSVDHLASTPKVILDSTSPLLKPVEAQDDFQERFIMNCQADHGVLVTNLDSDADLLSSFESMMDQISRDGWISSRTSCCCAADVDPDNTAKSAKLTKNLTSEVTLYFTRDDDPEECSTVASILQNYGVLLEKKDVSEDPTYLAGLIDHFVQVPALFINGRYIGGAEQVRELKEKDQLKLLLEGARTTRVCNGCCGICFVPCLDCNGSRRFMAEDGELTQCTECTEQGMVKCPLCSS